MYHVYACKDCEKASDEAIIVKTPKEPDVFPGSFASPEAIAYIMAQKYESTLQGARCGKAARRDLQRG